MGAGAPEDEEQLLAEGPGLPGGADVGVRHHGSAVQPLAAGLSQPDGEVLLVPLPRQRRLQLGPQVRRQAQEEQRTPVGRPANGEPPPPRHSLQAVEVLGEGSAAVGQEVVLEEEVEQQVELVEASPHEAEAGWVGLGQNLRGVSNAICYLKSTF